MARIDGFGISVELPSGFEGEVFGHSLRAGEAPATGVQAMSTLSAAEATATLDTPQAAPQLAPQAATTTTTTTASDAAAPDAAAPGATTTTTAPDAAASGPTTTTTPDTAVPESTTTTTPAPEERSRAQVVPPLAPAAPVAATAPPVLHAATFPLPPERGDFGNGAVDSMGPDDVFVALCEYDRESAGSALFAAEGFPVLTSADFSTSTLHRAFDNHSGCQKFFHVGDRAFCLYVVLGSHTFRGGLVRRANDVVARIEVATG